MRKFRDISHAKKVMTVFRGWVGTPVLVWNDRRIDGRIRADAYQALAFGEPPTVILRTKRELTRALIAAGEHARAEQLLGGKLEDYETAQALLRLARSELQPVVDRRQRYRPSQARPAREYLQKVIRLYYAKLEDGENSLSLTELGKCLNGYEGKKYV